MPLWLLLRLVNGFCVADVLACLVTWRNDQAEPKLPGSTLAYYMVALYGGQAPSQITLEIEDDASGRTLPS